MAALGESALDILSPPRSPMRRLGRGILTTLEAINVCWLVGTTIAQTSGLYQTCFCESAGFDSKGGYIQFDDVDHDDSPTIIIFWSVGTGVAGLILLASLVYFIVEWLEQSHLMTSDYKSAQKGLLWTRRYKRLRGWLLFVPMVPLIGAVRLYRLASRTRHVSRTRLAWST